MGDRSDAPCAPALSTRARCSLKIEWGFVAQTLLSVLLRAHPRQRLPRAPRLSRRAPRPSLRTEYAVPVTRSPGESVGLQAHETHSAQSWLQPSDFTPRRSGGAALFASRTFSRDEGSLRASISTRHTGASRNVSNPLKTHAGDQFYSTLIGPPIAIRKWPVFRVSNSCTEAPPVAETNVSIFPRERKLLDTPCRAISRVTP